ncbi:hypothetical protein [Streptococcus tangpeifui]|uniref:hypothetical protein n=1 Tax=Streptococcus tangpeifui TaxID=2709400 RepID=UPI0013EAF285|nr:hypothetical protein [Streptococcus sp. ZJ373]
MPKKTIDIDNQMEFRKFVSKSRKEMREAVKPKECVLCGKVRNGFCNSHTIPQLSLKNITESGMLLQSSYLIGNDIENERGLNNSGTIQTICNDCDSLYFQEYENENNLLSYPNDKILAQIALKNFLLELVRRKREKYEHQKLWSLENVTRVLKINYNDISENYLNGLSKRLEDVHNSFDYDIEDFLNEISIHKDVIENNLTGSYQVIFHEILPYKTPIAFQGSLTLIRDMYGYPINNTKDFSKENRIQKLHLAVLPLRENTMVLAFYHKRDRKYKSLKSQFNSSSRLKKLEFLNYLIFAYTENYYFSPKVKDQIRTDEKLVLLSQELFGEPNLGNNIEATNYKRVEPNEIPNFLLEDWALSE